MLYRVTHTTTYDYTEPVSLCQNLAHLMPRETAVQRCRQSTLSISPESSVFSCRVDYFGNPETFFSVQEPHRRLTVSADHLVEVGASADRVPARTLPWGAVREALRVDLHHDALDAAQFVCDSRYIRSRGEFADYARASFPPGRPLAEAVVDLTDRINHNFEYDPEATTVATSLAEVFALRRGVCQDFAQFQVACLRSLGLAARYVSGYLSTVPPPGRPPLVGTDATHAWVSVFCPPAGWIDFDPTNNQVSGDRYITLGWGRDYDDVSPLRGIVLGGGQHTVVVAVDVVPIAGVA